jgi:hypothetical protein
MGISDTSGGAFRHRNDLEAEPVEQGLHLLGHASPRRDNQELGDGSCRYQKVVFRLEHGDTVIRRRLVEDDGHQG